MSYFDCFEGKPIEKHTNGKEELGTREEAGEIWTVDMELA